MATEETRHCGKSIGVVCCDRTFETAAEADEHHRKELEEQQKIQMNNPPTSAKWQAASKMIHELVFQLTGKRPQDACGRR